MGSSLHFLAFWNLPARVNKKNLAVYLKLTFFDYLKFISGGKIGSLYGYLMKKINQYLKKLTYTFVKCKANVKSFGI